MSRNTAESVRQIIHQSLPAFHALLTGLHGERDTTPSSLRMARRANYPIFKRTHFRGAVPDAA